MISMSKLPRTGLANKLFVWAHGYLFSRINECPHITIGWVKIHVGPILRREKSMRFYSGLIPLSTSIDNNLIWIKNFLKKRKYLLPSDCLSEMSENRMYIFTQAPKPGKYFDFLSSYRSEIIRHFLNTLHPKIHKKVMQYKKPVIGVHIRLGDFKILELATPINYYINQLKLLRIVVGDLPATIFTDGSADEVQEILALDNVKMVQNDLDIVHLILLSKSDYIILTPVSTFSQWAGFLSDAPLFFDDNPNIKFIREDKELYEGSVQDFEPFLSAKEA